MCGDSEGFYCTGESDSSDKCKPRYQRCVSSDVCADEDGCGQTSNDGEYTINLGHSELGCFGFKRTILEHRFVTYRGFTYEFGKNYGVQTLDINDPDYKYINGRWLNSGGIEVTGTSYCTQDDADLIAQSWSNKKYNLFTRNCQHFAKAMITALTETSCNQPAVYRSDRRGEDLRREIDRILTNCSIVCCDEDNSASSTQYTNQWVVVVCTIVYSTLYKLML